MKNKLTLTIYDVVDDYLDKGLLSFDFRDLSFYEKNLFCYLLYKAEIANSDYKDLNDFLSEEDLFYTNIKIIKELIYNEGYFYIFKDNIKDVILSFVKYSRDNLENQNKRNSDEWEMINDLLCTYYEQERNLYSKTEEEQIKIVETFFNSELEDRQIKKFTKEFILNFPTHFMDDLNVFLLYKLHKTDKVVNYPNVMVTAKSHINMLNNLYSNYNCENIYIRNKKEDIRKKTI